MAGRSWHKSDIKAALEKRGLTLSALDLEHGLPDGTCSAALRKPHARGELIIAEALSLSPRQIWPNRYRDDGRLRPQPAENYKPTGSGRSPSKARHSPNSATRSTEHQVIE
jgi:Ner family transcriptional regulator